MPKSAIKLAVLISGNGSNLQSIIDHIEKNQLHGEIVCVISDQATAYGLTRAKIHDIDAHVISKKDYPHEAFEKKFIAILDTYNPDLLILAGFMRILSEEFINQFKNRILNIHPSLLPKYKGLNTHQRVLQANDTHHGATVHIVTRELDSGPIILQRGFEIDELDDIDSLKTKVHEIEHQLYPQAISIYSKNLHSNRQSPL